MLREVSIALAAGRADDGATVQKAAANRDRFLDLTLAENPIGDDPDRSLAGRRALSPNLLIPGVCR